MVRLALLAFFLAACSVAPVQPGIEATLPPAWALQDAQATGTAAARSIEATATAQVNLVATEARASIALAEAQTQAALPGMQTATAVYNANLVATATEGAAYHATQIHADLVDRQAQRDQENFNGTAWLVLGGLAVATITVVLCLAILRIGKAYETKVLLASIVIIRNENAPVGYFMPGPVPQYHSLAGGQAAVLEPEPDIERQCRDAWRKAVREVASAAALAGSWSVNTLSRNGGQWAEDTVSRVQAICAEIQALVNYGGTRGWDWAPGWSVIDLGQALDEGVWFSLPRKAPSPDEAEGALLWPIFPEQSKPKPSKAKVSKARAVV